MHEFRGAIDFCVRQQLYFMIMALQPFWRLGGLRALVTSATSELRTFFSSHTSMAWSSDPIKRRIQLDRFNDARRLKRRTDPEWLQRERDNARKSPCRSKEKTEDQRKAHLEQMRKCVKEWFEQDPVRGLRKSVHDVATRFDCFREALPWKSHVPILYAQKMPHRCDACLITRHGGSKLW